MNRKSTSVSSIVGVATALYLGLFAAQFQSAHADEAVQSAGPVSYTHLDVYKRQTYNNHFV